MTDRTANTFSFLGAGVLLSCACAVSASTAKLTTLAGLPASSHVFHPVYHGAGAALLLAGIWHRSRFAFRIGLAGALLLGLANYGVPPALMMMRNRPAYDALQTATLWLYLAAAVLLIWAVWRAYPFRRSGSSLAAMSGAVVAAGCTCCMMMGAMNGLTVTLAPALPVFFSSRGFYTLVGTAMLAAGLARISGPVAVGLALAGEAAAYWGPNFVKDTFPIAWNGIDLNPFLRYTAWTLAILAALSGFAIAWRREQAIAQPEREPEAVMAAL